MLNSCSTCNSFSTNFNHIIPSKRSVIWKRVVCLHGHSVVFPYRYANFSSNFVRCRCRCCCFLLLLLLFFVVVVKAAVWRQVQFILFYFANYSPSITMELKVSKEITCKWQNQRSETNKYVSWALFLKLQAAGINFEKLLGWTVFKNPNFNPFQSSSVLPIRGSCCICCVILTFL